MSVQIRSGADEPTPRAQTNATPAFGSAPPTRLSLVDRLLLGVAAALIVGLTFWAINKVVNPDEVDGYDARVACQLFILDRLEKPRTADFSDLEHTGAAPTWTVSGDLEADNSFGATTRSHFECRVRHDGANWLLISLTGLD